MKILTVEIEAAFIKKEVEDAVGWIRDAKGVKDPKQIEAYRAGMENGLGVAIARLSERGFISRQK